MSDIKEENPKIKLRKIIAEKQEELKLLEEQELKNSLDKIRKEYKDLYRILHIYHDKNRLVRMEIEGVFTTHVFASRNYPYDVKNALEEYHIISVPTKDIDDEDLKHLNCRKYFTSGLFQN